MSSPADAAEFADAERLNLIAITHQAATAPNTTPELAMRLTTALHWAFDFRGYWHDLITLRGIAAQTAHRLGDRRGEALARVDVGFVYVRVGRIIDAISTAQQALGICRDIGDRLGEQRCLLTLGFACQQHPQRLAEAIDYLEQGLAICQETGPARRHSWTISA